MTARQPKRRQPPSGARPSESKSGSEGEAETKPLPGMLVAHHGVAVEVRLASGERRKVKVRRRSGHVVGDRVEVVGERLRRLERGSQLRRRDAMQRTHVVAANLDLLGIVIAPLPPSPSGFVDRALVCAGAEGIRPFLVVNKADLPEAEALVASVRKTWLDGPGGVELPLFVLSAARASEDPSELQRDGLAAMLELFAQPRRDGAAQIGAFVGTSGVGKSSLLNALLPQIELTVGEINQYSGLGRHTTTTATLHTLPEGGELIDTPGFRDFGLVDIDAPTLSAHFPGFSALLSEAHCRFNDCRHDPEPDCAIKAAVADGRLAESRWARYIELLTQVREQAASRVP